MTKQPNEGPLFDHVYDGVVITDTLMTGAKNPVSYGMDAKGKVYILDEKGMPIKEPTEADAKEVRAAIKRGKAGAPPSK